MKSFWQEWLRPILTVLLVMGALRSSLADWNDVPTGSMIPTIYEGDRIWVNKLAYDLKLPFSATRLAQWNHPQRGDIVVFFSPYDGTRLVKRTIGLPGDSVSMIAGQLYVNEIPVPLEPVSAQENHGIPRIAGSSFAKENLAGREHQVLLNRNLPARRDFGPIRVPQNSYFMMGDYRDNSFDSRWFGCVARHLIVGQATSIVLSFNPDHYYLPRWDRFFSSLR